MVTLADDIDGEILSERDLVDAGPEDIIALPDGVDHEWLLGELWKDLLRGEHAKEILAEAEMRRIIEFNRSVEHRLIDGIGQLRCRVSLDTYLHWTARYGADFWKQEAEDNFSFFAKRNPGFLVDNFHKKTTVVIDRTLTGGEASGSSLPAVLDAGRPEVCSGEKRAGVGAARKAAPAPASPRSRRGGRWGR